MSTITLIGGVFMVAIMSYLLKDMQGGIYPLLITASVCIFALYAVNTFMPVIDELSSVVSLSEESGVIISIVVRVFLISVAVEILGSICQDLGMTSYKTIIIVFGNFAIVAIMLPLITSVLSEVISYIKSV